MNVTKGRLLAVVLNVLAVTSVLVPMPLLQALLFALSVFNCVSFLRYKKKYQLLNLTASDCSGIPVVPKLWPGQKVNKTVVELSVWQPEASVTRDIFIYFSPLQLVFTFTATVDGQFLTICFHLAQAAAVSSTIHWLVYLFLEREKQLLLIFRDMTEENRKYQQEFFTLKDKNDDVWIRHYGRVPRFMSQ